MELMVRFYGTAKRVAKEGLSAAVGYFESGFSRSNDIISIPNSAQQISPSHQGLKGIGRRNRSMISQRRHPDGMLLSVFAGGSIFNSLTPLCPSSARSHTQCTNLSVRGSRKVRSTPLMLARARPVAGGCEAL